MTGTIADPSPEQARRSLRRWAIILGVLGWPLLIVGLLVFPALIMLLVGGVVGVVGSSIAIWLLVRDGRRAT